MKQLFGMFCQNFGIEAIYSFVIILCALMIYFGIKELYELSSYKGIKYFRESFLFFAIAYFCGSFIKLSMAFVGIRKLFLSPLIFHSVSVFLFMYFSSMAIFYLIYSVMWKKWRKWKNNIIIFHILALIIAVISTIFQNTIIYLCINLIILISIIIITYVLYSESKGKKKFNLYGIYILLSIFWILNIWDILIPNFIKAFQIVIYLASIGIFMTILYKVLKKSGSN